MKLPLDGATVIGRDREPCAITITVDRDTILRVKDGEPVTLNAGDTLNLRFTGLLAFIGVLE